METREQLEFDEFMNNVNRLLDSCNKVIEHAINDLNDIRKEFNTDNDITNDKEEKES